MNRTFETTNRIHKAGQTGGLLAARGPVENLAVSDGTRIMCKALRIHPNQMILGAFGPEQTRIVYKFAEILAGYDGLNIRSVCTSRSEDAAGSYILLTNIHGCADILGKFGQDIEDKPWFEPVGERVIPEEVVDLKIIAPGNPTLLLDLLTIISGDYGCNIETMMFRADAQTLQDGPCAATATGPGAVTGNGGLNAGHGNGGAGLWTGYGGIPAGAPGTGGGEGGLGRGTGGLAGDGLGTAGHGGIKAGQAGRGGGGSGTGGPVIGGPGLGPGMGDVGAGRHGTTGDGTGPGGGETLSATHMVLELPTGTRLDDLQHDLDLVGKDWEIRWERRRGKARFDRQLTQRLFGGIN